MTSERMETDTSIIISDDNIIKTVSRVYANVLQNKPKEHWNYKNCTVEFGEGNHFSLISHLTCGSFQATDTNNDEMYLLKILKHQPSNKIVKEVCILRTLNGKNNVIKFLAPVKTTPMYKALLFEHVTSVDLSSICLTVTAFEIKYYMYELFKALDYCHSMGVMHRDIKPSNIIIDQCLMKLCLIIGKNAEFYRPGKKYSTDVTDLCYRSPELALRYMFYDYGVDMWAAGCLLAAMVFRKQPFFMKLNRTIETFAITYVLGSKGLLNYAKKYHIPVSPIMRKVIGTNRKQRWGNFITTEVEHLVNDDVIHLIDMLLQYDHMKRITAEQAMDHLYFMDLEAATKRIKLDMGTCSTNNDFERKVEEDNA